MPVEKIAASKMIKKLFMASFGIGVLSFISSFVIWWIYQPTDLLPQLILFFVSLLGVCWIICGLAVYFGFLNKWLVGSYILLPVLAIGSGVYLVTVSPNFWMTLLISGLLIAPFGLFLGLIPIYAKRLLDQRK